MVYNEGRRIAAIATLSFSRIPAHASTYRSVFLVAQAALGTAILRSRTQTRLVTQPESPPGSLGNAVPTRSHHGHNKDYDLGSHNRAETAEVDTEAITRVDANISAYVPIENICHTPEATCQEQSSRSRRDETGSLALSATLVRFVDSQVPTTEIVTIESGHGLRSIFHLDEPESAEPSRFTICDQLDGQHLSVLTEQFLDFALSCLERQVTDVELLGHLSNSPKKPTKKPGEIRVPSARNICSYRQEPPRHACASTSLSFTKHRRVHRGEFQNRGVSSFFPIPRNCHLARKTSSVNHAKKTRNLVVHTSRLAHFGGAALLLFVGHML